MPKIKIIYDRQNCIGAASCTIVAPKYWKLADDSKADLLDSKMNSSTGKYELEAEVSEDDFTILKDSAESCPVQVIEIIKES